jgi:ribonuclease D
LKIKLSAKLVLDRRDFTQCCNFLKQQSYLGIDLESDMNKHFGRNLSLLQLGNHKQQYIIDPLSYDISDLIPIFEAPNIQKIFFDGQQDIQMIKLELGCKITNIFDVALAYQWSWPSEQQKGLNEIIEEEYDVKISKKLQRTDWSIRPLTPAMIKYAALDVTYLVPLRFKIHHELVQKGWHDNANRVFDAMELIIPIEPEIEEIFNFIKIKHYQTYNPLEKLIIKRLYEMRTQWGKKKNKPVFFLLRNIDIQNLVKEKPTTLKEIEEIDIKQIKKRDWIKQKIIKLIKKTIKEYEEDNEIYQKEVEELEKIYKTIGRKNLSLLNRDLTTGIQGDINLFKARRSRLMRWRNQKSDDTGIKKDFILPIPTIQKLSTLDLKGQECIPLIPGITPWVQDQYNHELIEMLSFRDYRFFKGLQELIIKIKSNDYKQVKALWINITPKKEMYCEYRSKRCNGKDYRFTVNFLTLKTGGELNIFDESEIEQITQKKEEIIEKLDDYNLKMESKEKPKSYTINYDQECKTLTSEENWPEIYEKMKAEMERFVTALREVN